MLLRYYPSPLLPECDPQDGALTDKPFFAGNIGSLFPTHGSSLSSTSSSSFLEYTRASSLLFSPSKFTTVSLLQLQLCPYSFSCFSSTITLEGTCFLSFQCDIAAACRGFSCSIFLLLSLRPNSLLCSASPIVSCHLRLLNNKLTLLVDMSSSDAAYPFQVDLTDDQARVIRTLFDSIALAVFIIYQASAFFLTGFRIARHFYMERDESFSRRPNKAMMTIKGTGWLAAGIKMGAIETLLAFISNGWELVLARRLCRLLGRILLVVGLMKG